MKFSKKEIIEEIKEISDQTSKSKFYKFYVGIELLIIILYFIFMRSNLFEDTY